MVMVMLVSDAGKGFFSNRQVIVTKGLLSSLASVTHSEPSIADKRIAVCQPYSPCPNTSSIEWGVKCFSYWTVHCNKSEYVIRRFVLTPETMTLEPISFPP